MSKTIVVFGATGKQGGSVVSNIIANAQLSKEWKICGITRSTSSGSAEKLKAKGVEVVAANLDDYESMVKAMQGADVAFYMTTNPVETEGDQEFKQGKLTADAAVASGISHLIFSTLPSPNELSNGKYPVPGFDSKKRVENYIKSLGIKCSFVSPGSFMSNFHDLSRPYKVNDDLYLFGRPNGPSAVIPFVDIQKDYGKYVCKILENLDKYGNGEVLVAGSDLRRVDDVAKVLAEKSGKNVVYKEFDADQFASMIPNNYGWQLVNMMKYQEDYGYWGDQTEQLMIESNKGLENLSTVEFFLDSNPLDL